MNGKPLDNRKPKDTHPIVQQKWEKSQGFTGRKRAKLIDALTLTNPAFPKKRDYNKRIK